MVSECSPQQTARVSVAAGSSGSVSAAASAAAAAAVVAGAPSSSTMSVSRVPSPPPSSEANTPVAENWCYTQVRKTKKNLPHSFSVVLFVYYIVLSSYDAFAYMFPAITSLEYIILEVYRRIAVGTL